MPNTDHLLQRAVETGSFAAERALQWIGNALERQFRGDDLIASDQTPYEVIHRRAPMSVRKYAPLAEREIEVGSGTMDVAGKQRRRPVVLVPPLAATSMIFDLLPNRSLVKYLLASGYRVYLVDWGDPTEDHSHLSLKDYTTVLLPDALEKIRADSGERELSLLGYCMGGLFCLVYAGWSHDPDVKNIVTIASPIDAHQVGIAGKLLAMMNTPARLVRRLTPLRLHKLGPDRFEIPGWMASLAFKLTNPFGTVQSYIDLLMNLWDREYVVRHQTTAAWFDRMNAFPGGIVQDFVVRVGLDNALAKGRIKLDAAQESMLDRIQCSLLAIGGDNDRIVTLEAARKVMDIVGSEDKAFRVAPGGHAGVFGGSRAPDSTWRFAADWLATRSG